jgi:hypothetical protein
VHLLPGFGKEELRNLSEPNQKKAADAVEDYPKPVPQIQVFCVR